MNSGALPLLGKKFFAPFRAGLIPRHPQPSEMLKISYFPNHWSYKVDLPLILTRIVWFMGVGRHFKVIRAAEKLKSLKKLKFVLLNRWTEHYLTSWQKGYICEISEDIVSEHPPPGR